jgi:hypothetical protein
VIRQPGLLRQSGLFLSTDQIAVSLRRTDGSGHEDHQDHEDPNESIFGFVILVSFVIFYEAAVEINFVRSSSSLSASS